MTLVPGTLDETAVRRLAVALGGPADEDQLAQFAVKLAERARRLAFHQHGHGDHRRVDGELTRVVGDEERPAGRPRAPAGGFHGRQERLAQRLHGVGGSDPRRRSEWEG